MLWSWQEVHSVVVVVVVYRTWSCKRFIVLLFTGPGCVVVV